MLNLCWTQLWFTSSVYTYNRSDESALTLELDKFPKLWKGHFYCKRIHGSYVVKWSLSLSVVQLKFIPRMSTRADLCRSLIDHMNNCYQCRSCLDLVSFQKQPKAPLSKERVIHASLLVQWCPWPLSIIRCKSMSKLLPCHLPCHLPHNEPSHLVPRLLVNFFSSRFSALHNESEKKKTKSSL